MAKRKPKPKPNPAPAVDSRVDALWGYVRMNANSLDSERVRTTLQAMIDESCGVIETQNRKLRKELREALAANKAKPTGGGVPA